MNQILIANIGTDVDQRDIHTRYYPALLQIEDLKQLGQIFSQ